MTDVEPIDNRLFVLILQHPQEKREALATAAVTRALLNRAELVVGLSWPNLARALGHPADATRWAVLYLGSAKPAAFKDQVEVVAVNRRGEPVADQQAMLHGLEGVVVLDGTWKEAKTLWWRNPWLLKLRRLVLNPRHKSRYGRIRREPRREAGGGGPAVEASRRRARDRGAAAERPRSSYRRGATLPSARRRAGQQIDQDCCRVRHIERLHLPASGDPDDFVAEGEHGGFEADSLVAEDQCYRAITGRVDPR